MNTEKKKKTQERNIQETCYTMKEKSNLQIVGTDEGEESMA